LSKSFTSTAAGLAVDEGLLTSGTIWSFPTSPIDLPAEVSEEPREDARCATLFVDCPRGHSEGHASPAMFPRQECRLGENRTSWRWKSTPPARHAFHVQLGARTYMVASIFEQGSLGGCRWTDLPHSATVRASSASSIRGGNRARRVSIVGGWGPQHSTEEHRQIRPALPCRRDAGEIRAAHPGGLDRTRRQIVSHLERRQPRGATGNQGYGFQFWMCRHKRVTVAMEAFGQYCVVNAGTGPPCLRQPAGIRRPARGADQTVVIIFCRRLSTGAKDEDTDAPRRKCDRGSADSSSRPSMDDRNSPYEDAVEVSGKDLISSTKNEDGWKVDHGRPSSTARAEQSRSTTARRHSLHPDRPVTEWSEVTVGRKRR